MNEKYIKNTSGTGYLTVSGITTSDRQNIAGSYWNPADSDSVNYGPNKKVHKRTNNMMFFNGAVQKIKVGTQFSRWDWTLK